MATKPKSSKGSGCAGIIGLFVVLGILGKACGNSSTSSTTALAPAHLTHPVHIIGNGINVRRSALAEASPVGSVSSSDSVDYIGKYDGQWSQVRLRDGTTGYISNKFLEGIDYTPLVKSTIAAATSSQHSIVHKAHKAAAHKIIAHKARPILHPVELAYYCASGNTVKYHSSPSCRGLNRCSASVESMPLSEAEASMNACKFCH